MDRMLQDGCEGCGDGGAALPVLRSAAVPMIAAAVMSLSSIAVIGNALRLRRAAV